MAFLVNIFPTERILEERYEVSRKSEIQIIKRWF